MPKAKKKGLKLNLPKVLPSTGTKPTKEAGAFPVEHYSYSTFTRFSTNPIMFKITAINGDTIETTTSASNILGKACHKAMQVYFDIETATDPGTAMKEGYNAGKKWMDAYPEGFIGWNSHIKNRAQLSERYSYAYFEYMKGLNHRPKQQQTIMSEKMLKHTVSVDGHQLPIPLKGSADWVYEEKKQIRIVDHKFTVRHSGDEKIDGAKLLQAAFLYFLTYAELGKTPYSITFNELKVVPNADKKLPQLKSFTIVYEDVPLMFDLFYRFYGDVTDALMGRMVWVPNLNALYDNEVSLLAYIHRLDDDETKAKQLKKLKVDNITDFLRKKIAKSKSLQAFMETTAQKFVSAATLNYATMTTPEKIKMKLAEHGIGLEYDSAVVGPSVTLYRYEPSIGVKMTKLENYTKDIELVTSATGVRILAPIPGTDLVGFEVPNKKRTFLGIAPKAQKGRVAVGEDVQGNTQYIDLKDAPHVLIAGSTGSGKSVLLTSMLHALGGSVDLWLMDPKKVELQDIDCVRYGDTPDLIWQMLCDLETLMETRYAQLKMAKAKQWEGRLTVAVIDEFGDLMLSRTKKGFSKAEFEHLIVKLAQKARAAGIHLVIATQRPSTDVITGTIRANFSTRVALRTASGIDSQVILGMNGAEKLCGKGDMLLVRTTDPIPTRLQGFNV